MSHPDVITTIWDDPRNIETLKTMWLGGKSATQIAAIMSRDLGQSVTRNMVIGKVTRMKLQKRVTPTAQSSHTNRRTFTGKPATRANAGQPRADAMVHRVEGRLKAERARQEGKLSHRGEQPFRAPGRVDVEDDGVDVTSLIGFADRRINHQCAWVYGDPLEAGSGFCGKPTVEGTQWCREHHARVYTKQGMLNA